MNPQNPLARALAGHVFTETEAEALLRAMARGDLDPALAGGLLAALRARGETPAEVRGFARGMRALARRPALPAGGPTVDIVGTGGDGSGSLNLSTGAALLAAAAGCRVVKHGNRAISSRAGSADTLEALGYRMDGDPGAALSRVGFCFLYAPGYHPAMKAIAPVRRAMGVRTVFNLLGPICNPAAPDFLVLGAYSPAAARLLADALAGLPGTRAFVISGALGWDEPTPVGPFLRLTVHGGAVREETVDPRIYGVARCRPEDLAGGDAQENAAALRAILGGAPGPGRDALVLGAALALELSQGLAPAAAAAAAAAAIDDGRAAATLSAIGRAEAPCLAS
jgi:anthranilate phosphoribosyltransferase